MAVTADSGEAFRRPGGAIGRGRKGEEERRLGAIYRHRGELVTARINVGLREGGSYCGGNVTGEINARKKKAGLTGGAYSSARKGEEQGTGSGRE
jgi:hypothetical protein